MVKDFFLRPLIQTSFIIYDSEFSESVIIRNRERPHKIYNFYLKNKTKPLRKIEPRFIQLKKMANFYSFLVFFISFLFIQIEGSRPVYIKVHIDKKNLGHEVYSADFEIGSPPQTYRLQIDFGYDKIALFKDLTEVSTTFSKQRGGYDVVFFHKTNYFVPVVSDPRRNAINQMRNEFMCVDCVGILGMSYDSVFYKIFNKVGFSTSYISLGKHPDESRMQDASKIHHVNCESYAKGLCSTSGSISFGNVHYNSMRIEIDPSMQGIVLPPQIYDEYMEGKNVYSNSNHHSNWEPIEIRSFDTTFWRTVDMKIGEKQKEWTESLEYTLHPNNFVYESRTRARILGINRGPEDIIYQNKTVRLGDSVLRNLLIERTSEGLFLTEFQTFDNIDDVNLFFFIIQVILTLRWTVVNQNIYDLTTDWNLKYPWFEIFFEWTGVVISIVAIFLPQTFDLLENHQDIYIGTWFLLGFAVILKVFLKIYLSVTDKINYFIHRYTGHYVRLTDSFLTHVILLTGLWILVLQSRTEGGNSPLLFLVNVLLLFIISFYFIVASLDVFSIIIIQTRPLDKNNFIIQTNTDEGIKEQKIMINPNALPNFQKEGLFFLVIVTLAFAYQAVVTLNFFARPFFIKDLNLSDAFNIPILVLLFFFTMLISLIYASLLFSYSIAKWKKELKKNDQNIN